MKKPKQSRRHRLGWAIAAVIALALAVLTGLMLMNASLLHVMRATVAVADLPPAFEGTTILYLSDIDLCGLNTPARAAEAVMQLQSLHPDMLILGGDYTSRTVGDVLNKRTDAQGMLGRRGAFLQAVGRFEAPMGKYALAGMEDTALGDMTDMLKQNGFVPLNDTRNHISVGDDALWLVGVGMDSERVSDMGRSFRAGECVICVAESPDCFPRIVTAEASDSGRWADLCLAGRTHGGQIRVLGRSALTLTGIEQQFLSGWTRESGVPMLTSSGVGCEGANLRLGTRAEVWLITLTNVSRET